MSNYAENGGQTFAASTPIVNTEAYYTSPVATSKKCALLQNAQLYQPAPGKCDASCFKKSAIGLGIVLVVCGAISQGAGAAALRSFAGFSEIAPGLWAGAMVVAAGAVAIAAGHHATKNLITGIAATSAVAAAATVNQILFASWGLSGDLLDYTCGEFCFPDRDSIYCRCNYEHWETMAIASNITMIVTGSLAFIGSIWLLIVACIALCRKPNSFQVHALPVQYAHQVVGSHGEKL